MMRNACRQGLLAQRQNCGKIAAKSHVGRFAHTPNDEIAAKSRQNRGEPRRGVLHSPNNDDAVEELGGKRRRLFVAETSPPATLQRRGVACARLQSTEIDRSRLKSIEVN